MEGFKNSTRMKTFGDVAPQAYAKGGSVKPMVKAATKAPAKAAPKKADAPMKKAGGGDVSKMTRDQSMASMEKSSRAMTPAETRSLQAFKAAKAAAPKQGPLIGRGSISDREDNRALRAMPKDRNPMSAAEVRRLMEMDRPTNSRGAEAYKGGGKVGGSKVPFAVKKVMRKAEGGAVNQPPPMPEMPNQPAPPPPMISDTGSGYVPQPSGGFDPAQVKRMQELAAMMGNMPPPPQEPTPQSVFGGDMPAMPASAGMIKDLYNTSQGPMAPQEPTPQSVFGNVSSSGYGTSPGPMPEMLHEPVMPSQPLPNQALNRGVPEDLTWYNNMVKEALAARDAQQAAQRADQAATLQSQQEMAAQAQMDRGLGLDLGGRRNLAPSYGRNPYLPRS